MTSDIRFSFDFIFSHETKLQLRPPPLLTAATVPTRTGHCVKRCVNFITSSSREVYGKITIIIPEATEAQNGSPKSHRLELELKPMRI